MPPYTEVLFEELKGKHGNLGVIILNRPTVLNSLSHDMICAMYDQLQRWESAEHIKGVVIRAVEGKAFCAGGDLRLTYERHLKSSEDLSNFFRDEYQLNRFIFHYPKPYIAFLDGITMGGGVGISIHGSHRIATERLLFAMPETGIGFFPDIGGTYFLPRLPGYFGFYLGLTGARITNNDATALGLTTQMVPHEQLPNLLDELVKQPFGDQAKNKVTDIINQFILPLPAQTILNHQTAIDECFSCKTVEEIVTRISNSSNPLCRSAGEVLPKKSPTSLKVTLYAIQQGKTLDFDTCMQQEFAMTCHFLEEHDFIEGIRALIIDKDQTPKWRPSTLEEVSSQMVKKYFLPVSSELGKKSVV